MTPSRARRDRGATLPIVALLLPVLILMTAFAVDLGRQRSSRRTMQARADIVALDLVRLTGTATWNGIISDPGYGTYLNESAARNQVDPAQLTVVWGTFAGDVFQACTTLSGCNTISTIPTAVQVTARETTDYFFQPGSGDVVRSAVATSGKTATLKLGSFAARLSTGGSPLLQPILGDALNTSLVGYEGLVDSDIDLGLLAAELGAGTPSQLLGTDVTVAELFHASAEALRNDPDSDATDLANANLLDAFATSVAGTGNVALGDIVSADTGNEAAALTGTVNAFDLLAASALVANGDSALAVPTLTINLPGLLQLGTPCSPAVPDDTEVCSAVSVIQGPVLITGKEGTSRSTKQASVRLGTQGGIPGLAGATTQVNLSLAPSLGRIGAIGCGSPRTVRGDVTTGLADASVRITATVTVRVLFIDYAIPVVISLDRAPSTATESQTFTELSDGTFTPPYFEAGTQDLGLSGITPAVSLNLAGVPGAVQGLVNGAVTLVLAPVLSALGTVVVPAIEAGVQPLLNQLGLNLAGADLSALDAECNLPMLVQ